LALPHAAVHGKIEGDHGLQVPLGQRLQLDRADRR
jgi:hypothetical protein